MARRRPPAAHVVAATHQGQRLQFIATSAPDLAGQLRRTWPELPPALVDQLARLVIAHQARLELPGQVTLRHVSTLTATPAPVAAERAALQPAAPVPGPGGNAEAPAQPSLRLSAEAAGDRQAGLARAPRLPPPRSALPVRNEGDAEQLPWQDGA